MKGLKKMFTTKAFRAGSYSAFAVVIVIAIAIALNLVVSSLPASTTKIDMTREEMFSISDDTRRVVRTLSEDVTIYLYAVSGQENINVTIMLERYADLSSHIKIKYIDPVIYPEFCSAYTDETDTQGALIVECGDRSRFISPADLFETTTTVDYLSYSNGGYETEQAINFMMEDLLTSAIYYVISDSLPHVYVLTGHGETALTDYVADEINLDGYEIVSFNLMTSGEIPEDCDAIFIQAPQSDLTYNEVVKLVEYLNAGGNVLLITPFIADTANYPNLLLLCQALGLTLEPGLVVDADAAHYFQAGYFMLPDLRSHEITRPLIEGGYNIGAYRGQSIVETERGCSGEYSALLSTSQYAYRKVNSYTSSSYARTESDPVGPFTLAACIEAGSAHFVWFTSPDFLSESVGSVVANANLNLFMNALNWACEQDDRINISGKTLTVDVMTLTAQQSSRLNIIFIGVVPACLLVIGLIIYIRRKRK